MKCSHIFTLFFCLISFGAAIPVPGPGSDDGNGEQPPRLDKGKGRAVDPPNQPPSRPDTPTPEHDPSVPLPGRTGIHTDPNTNVVTLHYGDDELHEHMGHLQRNQAEFPHNRNPLPLSTNAENNRYHALRNIPLAGPHPVTGVPRVRDEKLPNMLHNPHHSTSTTVEYLPDPESHKEGGHTSSFQAAINKAGPNAQGQLRPNPGWLPLHPDQRRGHEAPARLNSQTFADGSRTSGRTSGKRAQKGPSASQAKANREEAKVTGYTPPSVGPSQMSLRHRQGRPAPPPLPPPRERRPAQDGSNNLRPGHVASAGHVWRPSTDSSRASHFGAPGHLKEAEQRYPPRPQNHEHYMKQLQEAKDKETKHKAASESHKAPSTRKDMAKYLPKHTANLEKFEKQFGPARQGNGVGMAHEAPARMQTHVHHSAPLTRPPSPHEHQSRPSSPHPPSKSHGSNSKPGPSKRK